MKKTSVALAVVTLAASATFAFAGGAPKTGINGSFHDIDAQSGYQNKDVYQRTCVFCHTPHNAVAPNVDGADAPLWNHKLAADNTAYTTNPYQWAAPTNQGITIGDATGDPLVGPSRLCMSCHDGETAVDSHGSAGGDGSGSTAGSKMTSGDTVVDVNGTHERRFIKDLTVTHPIGFKWDDAVAARPGELEPKTQGYIADTDANQTILLGGNFDTHNRTGITTTSKTIENTLYNGYMTCATCHDVHNTVNASPSSTSQSYNYFLYAREEGSAICLSCHVK